MLCIKFIGRNLDWYGIPHHAFKVRERCEAHVAPNDFPLVEEDQGRECLNGPVLHEGNVLRTVDLDDLEVLPHVVFQFLENWLQHVAWSAGL